jgi:hypothetical protein
MNNRARFTFVQVLVASGLAALPVAIAHAQHRNSINPVPFEVFPREGPGLKELVVTGFELIQLLSVFSDSGPKWDPKQAEKSCKSYAMNFRNHQRRCANADELITQISQRLYRSIQSACSWQKQQSPLSGSSRRDINVLTNNPWMQMIEAKGISWEFRQCGELSNATLRFFEACGMLDGPKPYLNNREQMLQSVRPTEKFLFNTLNRPLELSKRFDFERLIAALPTNSEAESKELELAENLKTHQLFLTSILVPEVFETERELTDSIASSIPPRSATTKLSEQTKKRIFRFASPMSKAIKLSVQNPNDSNDEGVYNCTKEVQDFWKNLMDSINGDST